MTRTIITGLLIVPLAACGPKLIPNSSIPDTPETRQILDVVVAYRDALQNRDVEKITSLLSPTFFETSGTPEGADDYDLQGLKTKLNDWVSRTKAVRADFQVKNIVVEGDRAKAQFFYEVNYQVATPEGPPLWMRDADTKEMVLKKEDGMWRITSGI